MNNIYVNYMIVLSSKINIHINLLLGAKAPLQPTSSEALYVCLYACMQHFNSPPQGQRDKDTKITKITKIT